MAGDKSNKDVLVTLLEDAATLGGMTQFGCGSVSLDDVAATRSLLENAGLTKYWLAALPVSSGAAKAVVFVDVYETALSDPMLIAASKADTVVLVASAKTALADMRVKRQGELYNRAIAAHALGIKRLVTVVTDAKDATADDRAQLLAEINAMTTSCGLEEQRTRTVFLPATADDIVDAVASITHGSSVRYVAEPARTFTATGMVLNGSGVAVGDVIQVFTVEPISCRVESLTAARTPGVGDKSALRELRLHQTGTFTLSVVGTDPRKVAVAGPLIIHKRGRVLVMGSVIECSLAV
jgi:hypothetical protein